LPKTERFFANQHIIHGDLGDDVDECDESEEEEPIKVKVLKDRSNVVDYRSRMGEKSSTFIYNPKI